MILQVYVLSVAGFCVAQLFHLPVRYIQRTLQTYALNMVLGERQDRNGLFQTLLEPTNTGPLAYIAGAWGLRHHTIFSFSKMLEG